jgi:hypothetical protein
MLYPVPFTRCGCEEVPSVIMWFIHIFAIVMTALPSAAILWQILPADKNRATWMLKTLALSSFQVFWHFAMLWAFVSVYARNALLIVYVLAVAYSGVLARKKPFLSRMGAAGWIKVCLLVSLACLFLPLSVKVADSSTMPSVEPVHLAFPFRHGTFYIANGGNSIYGNLHLGAKDNAVVPQYRGQSWALDILKLTPAGNRSHVLFPSSLDEFCIFGESLYAPCDGEIIAVEHSLADQIPPTVDSVRVAGNHILLKRDESCFIVMAHLQRGSVRVQPGQKVHEGDLLALVGNSGNTSEPHLHINAQSSRGNKTVLDADPRPILFEGRWLIRNNIVRIP